MIDEANQQLRFFIVDDDPSIVDLQKALLEEAGHQAQSTTDSTAAMERIRVYAPDCVLLDHFVKTDEIFFIPRLWVSF